MLTDDKYRENLNELLRLKDQVTLDADPIAIGLNSFNDKISELESCRERVSALLTEAIWNKAEYEQLHKEAEDTYKIKVNEVLLRPDVLNLKSQDLRMARVNTILEEDFRTMNSREKALHYAEAYLHNVKNASSILEAKNDNLFKQIDIVKAMMGIDPSLREELRVKRGGPNV
jgi:tRNA(Phe) wybutosine-synthesizing methylase Tyw3